MPPPGLLSEETFLSERTYVGVSASLLGIVVKWFLFDLSAALVADLPLSRLTQGKPFGFVEAGLVYPGSSDILLPSRDRTRESRASPIMPRSCSRL